jgi:glycosyltransferase involved in cell wall biosynthesis
MTSSSSEAFPITLLEAMSVGLPVVATNVAGIPDIVIHGQTGFTAEPTDIQQLAHYLVRFGARLRTAPADGANRLSSAF